MDTLTEESALSRRAVIQHLGAAQKLGWIVARDRQGEGQGWRRKEYYAAIPPAADAEVERGAPDAPRRPAVHSPGMEDIATTALADATTGSVEGGAPDAPRSEGGAPGSEGGAPGAPEYFSSTSEDNNRAREAMWKTARSEAADIKNERLRRRFLGEVQAIISGLDATVWRAPDGSLVDEAERPRLFELALIGRSSEHPKLRSALRYVIAHQVDPHALPQSTAPPPGSEAAAVAAKPGAESPGRWRSGGGGDLTPAGVIDVERIRRESLHAGTASASPIANAAGRG